MPSACGLACEVCGLREKGFCPGGDGCVAGTDPKAPEKLEKFKAGGFPCRILECAIKNNVDHCLRCDKFPCEVHYQQGGPFSKKALDMIKGGASKEVEDLCPTAAFSWKGMEEILEGDDWPRPHSFGERPWK